MSSLRDIMDVDVEPLDSQAYRRQQAAQQQLSLPSFDQPAATPSQPLDDKNKGKTSIKRRRSDRVSKPSSSTSTPGPNIICRRSSAAREAMNFQYGNQADMGLENFTQASLSGSPPQSSRGSEQPTSEAPVKYTPVTGRISRAKKGVPVHTCDICRPIKTFTRAEHLRRHQLSHQKPAYPCTFEDCERAFHRPDLLARHLHRHETQGEKPYKSTGSRSRRASSSASESRTPSLKVETPLQNPVGNRTSPGESITSRTSGGAESSMTSFSVVTSNFQAVNFSPDSVSSHKRSASEAQLPGAGSYSPASPSSSQTARPPANFSHITSSPYQSNNDTNLANGDSFSSSPQPDFGGVFYDGNSPTFPDFTSSHSLPLLRIPEETYIPGLSRTQDNSPWCSSASDSTYSTQSEGSRNGRLWAMRSRAHSLNTTSDWPGTIGASQWSPLSMTTIPLDLRSPGFDTMMEHYETPYSSPRMTPPTSTRQLLDVPNSFGGYYMESVGTPALPAYNNKPMAQIFSASPTRISDSGLAGLDGRKDMVESQSLRSLGTLTTGSHLSYQTQLAQLDRYISSYWQSFDPLSPIIHRGTFDPTEDSLLSSAMAAIGTQYHDSPEARQKGVELNEYCRKSIGLCLNWNLNTMCAILLTEIFTRFRGRKTSTKTSQHFKDLYNRLLNNSSRDQTPFSTHSSHVASNDALLDPFNPAQPTQNFQQSNFHSEWIQWAENEGRQRLLAACFMFDIHQSIYHEQQRSDIHMEETVSVLCLPCPDNLWNASTAEEWQSQSAGCTMQQIPLIEQDLSSQYVLRGSSSFTHTLYICSLATRLPIRDDPTYPNYFLPNNMDSAIINLQSLFPTSPLAHSYLALNHTPLHDLLAIAGDTWVFGKKITPPEAFHSAQSRLKQWSSSLAAAAATQHACHVISTVLQPQSPEPNCVSHYWALYTAALICWAFGHKGRFSASVASGSLSRVNSLPVNNDSTMDLDAPLASTPDEAKLKALKYVNGMLALGTEGLLTSKASVRGDTIGVIDAVRTRLEVENVGNKCMMVVDAIMVLTRIKEGGRGKWF